MNFRIAGAAVAAAIALPAVAAGATSHPTIRVEGGAGTVIPQTPIPVRTAGTVAVADTTDADSITVTAASATAQAATATGWFGLSLGFDIFDFGGPSSFVTQLGAEKMPPSFSPSWRLKVDHKLTATGSDTTELGGGADVLWSFVNNFEAPELDVAVTRGNVAVGASFRAKVTSYGNAGVGKPAAGAAVRFAGTTVIADADGLATFAPTSPGPRFVTATLRGAVRSPQRLVCVHDGDNAPCSGISLPRRSGRVPAPHALIGLTSSGGAEVSIAKIAGSVGAGRDARTACRFLTATRRKFSAPRDCARRIWLPASVRNGFWTFELPGASGRLGPGQYFVLSRALAGTRREAGTVAGINLKRISIARGAAY